MANVERFAKFLREFSSQTQFIVVAHREGTMEECDLVYGATMQQKGVTKLVSVKLEDAVDFSNDHRQGGVYRWDFLHRIKEKLVGKSTKQNEKYVVGFDKSSEHSQIVLMN